MYCKRISVGAAQVDEEEMSITAKARGIWVREQIPPRSEADPSTVFTEYSLTDTWFFIFYLWRGCWEDKPRALLESCKDMAYG